MDNGYVRISKCRRGDLPGAFERHAKQAQSEEFREAAPGACRDTIQTLTAIALRDPEKIDEAFDILQPLMTHPYRPVRIDLTNAFLALGCAYPDRAGDSLTALAVMRDEDQSFELRRDIVHAAGILGRSRFDLAEQAFHLVDYFTGDSSPAVRVEAVNKLALIGKAYWRWREPAIEKMERLKTDNNTDVLTAASNRCAELKRKSIDDYISADKNEEMPPPFLM